MTRCMMLLACLASSVHSLRVAPLSAPAVAARAHTSMMAKKPVKSKSVTIILDADVDGLGTKGMVVDVKPAYAENVIRRQNLGTIATPADLERIASEQAAADAAAVTLKKKAEEARDAINEKYGKSGMTIEVQMSGGAIAEDVTSATVAEMLKRAAGVTVAPDDVNMADVTELGSVVAQLALHPEVSTSLKVTVEKSKITFS